MVTIPTKSINHLVLKSNGEILFTIMMFWYYVIHGFCISGAASPALLHPALQSAHLQQLQQLQSHIHELRRSAELRSSPFLSPQNSLLHSSPALHSAQTGYFPVFGTSGSPFTPVGKDPKEFHNMSKPESSSNVVSSTMDDDDKSGIKVGELLLLDFILPISR